MGTPYEKSFEVPAVTSGEDNHVQLRYPPRGELNKIIVKQVSGVLAGFEFDIYNSKSPLENAGLGGPGSSSAEAGGFDDANFKVLPTQTVAAPGAAKEMLGTDHTYPYCNRDGSPSNLQRFIYIRIKPSGTGQKDFQVTLGMQPPEF